MSKSTYAIRYFTKTGNTKKLADELASIVGVRAETVDSPIVNETDILFLGCSVYAGGVSNEVKTFIASLDKEKIKKVIVFSTSALAERGYNQVYKLLKEKEIHVLEDNFYCRGEFKILHRGRPNANDLKDLSLFVKKVLEV